MRCIAPSQDDTGKRAAESEEPAKPPKPSAAPDLSRPAKVQRTEASEERNLFCAAGRGQQRAVSCEAPEPQLTQPAPLPLKQLAEVLQVPPAPEAEAAKAWTPSWLQETSEGDTAPTDHLAQVPEREFLDQDGLDQALSWDERCVIVRQGQVHIELQRRNPPMDNADLLRFCDWLDEQMPLVVNHFPYVKKSGAYVDLSDNEIGTDGLDKLFQVLRGHRVPCVVLKAYRNSIDDSFVDTLVEYLYTQPEAFPMHGIHISHNDISDKGAFRLIRAAAQCGHYPRLTTRLPLWLRLEVNALTNPQKVIKDANNEGFTVCLMQDGLCSREKCDHYSGVHVQLPYFLNQPAKGFANLEQFGASQRRQTWAAPYSSSQGTLAPKAASPVGTSD
ncbi:dnc, partial [Symbiodinium sp. KB8]